MEDSRGHVTASGCREGGQGHWQALLYNTLYTHRQSFPNCDPVGAPVSERGGGCMRE